MGPTIGDLCGSYRWVMNPPSWLVITLFVVFALATGGLGLFIVHRTFKSVLGLDIPELVRLMARPTTPKEEPPESSGTDS